MHGYPLIFFSDSNNPCQDLLFSRSYKPRKNISVLARTAVKKTGFLGPLRDAQNVCAVAKGGIVLNLLSYTTAMLSHSSSVQIYGISYMSLSSLHLYGCRDQFQVSLIAQLVEHCACIVKVTNKIMPAKYFVGILFESKRSSVFG